MAGRSRAEQHGSHIDLAWNSHGIDWPLADLDRRRQRRAKAGRPKLQCPFARDIISSSFGHGSPANCPRDFTPERSDRSGGARMKSAAFAHAPRGQRVAAPALAARLRPWSVETACMASPEPDWMRCFFSALVRGGNVKAIRCEISSPF